MGSERYIIHAMNKIYSRDELNYKPRWLTDRIQQAVVDHPIVVLTGARQVGKSTLLQHASPMQDWRYVTMDNADTLAQALSHPESLWAGTTQIVIDETQKAPAILSAIKQAVDHAGRRELRFLISGSANLLLMKQVSESLAGRAVYFVLNPMTIGEQLERPAPNILSDLLAGTLPSEGAWSEKTKISVAEWLLRGFLPPLFDLPRAEVWSQWWEGYVGTYLERDLRQIANIDAQGLKLAAFAVFPRERLDQRPVAVPDADRAAAGQDALCHRQADALAAAGDNGRATVQIIIVHGPMSCRQWAGASAIASTRKWPKS